MRCAEFERQIQELLDADPRNSLCSESLPATLSAHALSCPGCQKLLKGYHSMFVGLAELAQSRGSGKVLADMPRRDHHVTRSRRIRHADTFAWYSAAACAVMLMTFAVTRRDQAGPVAYIPPQMPNISGPAVVPLQAESMQMASATVEASQALPMDPRRFDLDQASLGVVLNLAGFRPVTFSAEVLETQWSRQPAWMVEVADGLRPVTESVTGTLDALKRVLPGSATEDPNQGAQYNRYNLLHRIS